MVLKYYIYLLFLSVLITACNIKSKLEIFSDTTNKSKKFIVTFNQDSVSNNLNDSSDIKFIISTFRGNEKRNYYGNSAPSGLEVIWKLYLGAGHTNASPKHGGNLWAGAGWTGQPLLISEKGKLFLIQGAFDHNLKKIDAETGEIIWQYEFDDIIKGTGTIWENKKAPDENNRFVIFQGSRRGYNFNRGGKNIFSFRAISFISGEELFRMNIKPTISYSSDVDGSALVINDTGYIGLENGIFTVFNPDYQSGEESNDITVPEIINESYLFERSDAARHGGNLVTESSPAFLFNKIFITAGSGRVYSYNPVSKDFDWKFYIGSDLDGTPVVTSDSCLLVSVEYQYIKGRGGLLKLNPLKPEEDAVEWYFPTKNFHFSSWDGGIIGTPAVNDLTKKAEEPFLAAFCAIDGNLYVVKYKETDGEDIGFDGKTMFPKPELVFNYHIGSSISSPVIVGNKIVAAGYGGIFLFEFDDNLDFTLLDKKSGSFEASPIVYNEKIYIACRDGYLYCLGN